MFFGWPFFSTLFGAGYHPKDRMAAEGMCQFAPRAPLSEPNSTTYMISSWVNSGSAKFALPALFDAVYSVSTMTMSTIPDRLYPGTTMSNSASFQKSVFYRLQTILVGPKMERRAVPVLLESLKS